MSDQNPYAAPQSHISAPALPPGELPYATRLRRLGSALLDALILLPVNFIAAKMFSPVVDQAWAQKVINEKGPLEGMQAITDASRPGLLGQLALLAIVFGAYTAINWVFLKNGQTIGKKLTGIQIQSRNGGLLPVKDIIVKRFLIIQLAATLPGMIHPLLGILGGLFVLADVLCIFRSGYNTLHDDIANSKVVKLPA
jgi:uncharacterized RDD family membrane protein YckC